MCTSDKPSSDCTGEPAAEQRDNGKPAPKKTAEDEPKDPQTKQPSPAPAPSGVVAQDGLYSLDDTNFDGHIAEGEHFVKFFTPHCKHCVAMAAEWEELAKRLENDRTVKISEVRGLNRV